MSANGPSTTSSSSTSSPSSSSTSSPSSFFFFFFAAARQLHPSTALGKGDLVRKVSFGTFIRDTLSLNKPSTALLKFSLILSSARFKSDTMVGDRPNLAFCALCIVALAVFLNGLVIFFFLPEGGFPNEFNF